MEDPTRAATLERIVALEGPAQGAEADYWRELSEWQDWARWAPPAPAEPVTPDWRQV